MLDNDDSNGEDFFPSSLAAEDTGLGDNVPLSDPKGEDVLPSLFVVVDPPNGFDVDEVIGVVVPCIDDPNGEDLSPLPKGLVFGGDNVVLPDNGDPKGGAWFPTPFAVGDFSNGLDVEVGDDIPLSVPKVEDFMLSLFAIEDPPNGFVFGADDAVFAGNDDPNGEVLSLSLIVVVDPPNGFVFGASDAIFPGDDDPKGRESFFGILCCRRTPKRRRYCACSW